MSQTYLKKSEVAALLRVTTRTIENYVKTGKIPQPLKLGARPLWLKDAVIAKLSNRSEGSNAAAAAA